MINILKIQSYIKKNWLILSLSCACMGFGSFSMYVLVFKGNDTTLQLRIKKLEKALNQALEKAQAMGQSQQKNAQQLKGLLKKLDELEHPTNQAKKANELPTTNPTHAPHTASAKNQEQEAPGTRTNTNKQPVDKTKAHNSDAPEARLDNLEQMLDGILHDMMQENKEPSNTENDFLQDQSAQQQKQMSEKKDDTTAPRREGTHNNHLSRPLTEQEVKRVHQSFDVAQAKQTQDYCDDLAKTFLKDLVNTIN